MAPVSVYYFEIFVGPYKEVNDRQVTLSSMNFSPNFIPNRAAVPCWLLLLALSKQTLVNYMAYYRMKLDQYYNNLSHSTFIIWILYTTRPYYLDKIFEQQRKGWRLLTWGCVWSNKTEFISQLSCVFLVQRKFGVQGRRTQTMLGSDVIPWLLLHFRCFLINDRQQDWIIVEWSWLPGHCTL